MFKMKYDYESIFKKIGFNDKFKCENIGQKTKENNKHKRKRNAVWFIKTFT